MVLKRGLSIAVPPSGGWAQHKHPHARQTQRSSSTWSFCEVSGSKTTPRHGQAKAMGAVYCNGGTYWRATALHRRVDALWSCSVGVEDVSVDAVTLTVKERLVVGIWQAIIQLTRTSCN